MLQIVHPDSQYGCTSQGLHSLLQKSWNFFSVRRDIERLATCVIPSALIWYLDLHDI